MSHLKIAEVVLGHCNIVNNNYPQNSSVLYTFKTKQRLKISILSRLVYNPKKQDNS